MKKQEKYHKKQIDSGLVRRAYYHKPENAQAIKDFIKKLEGKKK